MLRLIDTKGINLQDNGIDNIKQNIQKEKNGKFPSKSAYSMKTFLLGFMIVCLKSKKIKFTST